jgi:hypothetical protein
MAEAVLHVAGPGALEYLRQNVAVDVCNAMPTEMVVEDSPHDAFPGVRVRLAKFWEDDENGSGWIWAYLSSNEPADTRPTLTLQAEIESPKGSGLRIIPVCAPSDPVTGAFISMQFVMDFVHARSYREMFAFVAYWFLWAKEKKKMLSAKHVVPITQELMDSLARVCGRQGFQEKNERDASYSNFGGHYHRSRGHRGSSHL